MNVCAPFIASPTQVIVPDSSEPSCRGVVLHQVLVHLHTSLLSLQQLSELTWSCIHISRQRHEQQTLLEAICQALVVPVPPALSRKPSQDGAETSVVKGVAPQQTACMQGFGEKQVGRSTVGRKGPWGGFRMVFGTGKGGGEQEQLREEGERNKGDMNLGEEGPVVELIGVESAEAAAGLQYHRQREEEEEEKCEKEEQQQHAGVGIDSGRLVAQAAAAAGWGIPSSGNLGTVASGDVVLQVQEGLVGGLPNLYTPNNTSSVAPVAVVPRPAAAAAASGLPRPATATAPGLFGSTAGNSSTAPHAYQISNHHHLDAATGAAAARGREGMRARGSAASIADVDEVLMPVRKVVSLQDLQRLGEPEWLHGGKPLATGVSVQQWLQRGNEGRTQGGLTAAAAAAAAAGGGVGGAAALGGGGSEGMVMIPQEAVLATAGQSRATTETGGRGHLAGQTREGGRLQNHEAAPPQVPTAAAAATGGSGVGGSASQKTAAAMEPALAEGFTNASTARSLSTAAASEASPPITTTAAAAAAAAAPAVLKPGSQLHPTEVVGAEQPARVTVVPSVSGGPAAAVFDPFVALAAVPLPGSSPMRLGAAQATSHALEHGARGNTAAAGGMRLERGVTVPPTAAAGSCGGAGIARGGAGRRSVDGGVAEKQELRRSRTISTAAAGTAATSQAQVPARRSMDGCSNADLRKRRLRKASSFTPSAAAAAAGSGYPVFAGRPLRVSVEAPAGEGWGDGGPPAPAAAAGAGGVLERVSSIQRASTLLTAFSEALKSSLGGSGGGGAGHHRTYLGGGSGGGGGLSGAATLREVADVLSCDGVSDDATVLETMMEVVGGRQRVEEVMTEGQRAAIRR